MSLRNVFLIWKRDLKGYFYTPLAYIFLGMVSVILFFMFWAFLRTYIFKAGFMDGRMGLILALFNGQTTYYKYLRIFINQRGTSVLPNS